MKPKTLKTALQAVAITTGACLAFALMMVEPAPSFGWEAPEATAHRMPCKYQLQAWQADLSIRDKIKGWYCPDPEARTMPIPPPGGQSAAGGAGGPSAAGGGFAGGLPTTEGQAQQMIMGMLIQSLFSSGPSAADQAAQQQQQALLKQQQELEKQKAEMLQRERAAQAAAAASAWQAQDAQRGEAMASLFAPPSETSTGMSSLLQKQALLQLRGAASPVDGSSDEALRRTAGMGLDEPAQTLADLPAVPEPPEPVPAGSLDPAVVQVKIKETKARVEELDKDLSAARQKQEKAREQVEQAKQDLEAKKEEAKAPGKEGDNLLAELEAEEANIQALEKELEGSEARVKELEGELEKEARDLETLNGKLETAKAP